MSPFDDFRLASRFGRLAQVGLCAAAGFLALSALPAQAASAKIQPIPAAECEALKLEIEKISGLKLASSVEDPDDELFGLEDEGLACVISGEGTGATRQFGDVSVALSDHFKDWTPLQDLAADGPNSSRMGFSKGTRTLIYSISAEPPEGKCEVKDDAEDLPECNLPAGEWEWAVDLIAYDKAG